MFVAGSGRQEHETIRFVNRKRAQHQAVDERKHRRVCADAERQGENRDRRHDRRRTKRPEGEPEIVHGSSGYWPLRIALQLPLTSFATVFSPRSPLRNACWTCSAYVRYALTDR